MHLLSMLFLLPVIEVALAAPQAEPETLLASVGSFFTQCRHDGHSIYTKKFGIEVGTRLRARLGENLKPAYIEGDMGIVSKMTGFQCETDRFEITWERSEKKTSIEFSAWIAHYEVLQDGFLAQLMFAVTDFAKQWPENPVGAILAVATAIFGVIAAATDYLRTAIRSLPFLNLYESIYRPLQYNFFPTDLERAAKERAGLSLRQYRQLLEDNNLKEEIHIALFNDKMLDVAELSCTAGQFSRFKKWVDDVKEKKNEQTIFRVIVAGQTSDGKSTLVNKLLGSRPPWGSFAEAKAQALGTTKEVQEYEVTAKWVPPDMRLILYDIPGYGDATVTPVMTLKQLEKIQKRFEGKAAFDALLLCAKATDGSLMIGPLLVGDMVKVAFDGQYKWECMVWCGTHGDLCGKPPEGEEDKKKSFVGEKLTLLNEKIGGHIPPENACVVDCLPLRNNSKSPGLQGLRDILVNLMKRKMQGELSQVTLAESPDHATGMLERIQKDIGNARVDAEMERELMRMSAERSGTPLSELEKKWAENAQKEKQKREEAEAENDRLRNETLKKDADLAERDMNYRKQQAADKAELDRKLKEEQEQIQKLREDLERQKQEAKRIREEEAKELEEEKKRLRAETEASLETLTAKFEKLQNQQVPLVTGLDVFVKKRVRRGAFSFYTNDSEYLWGNISGYTDKDGEYLYSVQLEDETESSFKRDELILWSELVKHSYTVPPNQKGNQEVTAPLPDDAVYVNSQQNIHCFQNPYKTAPFHIRAYQDSGMFCVTREDARRWQRPIEIEYWAMKDPDARPRKKMRTN